MALRPADRYPTALDLAADVEHWLADEPVAAYPDAWTARAGRWARRHRTVLVGTGVFLVSAVVLLSASTVLVWAEQQKTFAEQQKTAEQKQMAEENFKLARDMTYKGIALLERSEATFAADPALHSVRKDLLIKASQAFQGYLRREPDDPELRKGAAQVFRYTANVHRLENETTLAEQLLVDTIRLLRGLVDEYPDDKPLHAKLSLALRDFGSLQKKLGRLKEAAASLNGKHGAIELATALETAEPNQPAYIQTLAVAQLGLSSVEFVQGNHAASLETATAATDRFRKLWALPGGQGSHPYDRLLLAAALNLRAMNQRELSQLKDATVSHQDAIQHLTAMMKAPPRGVNVDDIRHYLAACLYEQCRTWSHFPEKRKSTETNLGAAESRWKALSEQFANFPDYREGLADALRERGSLRLADSRLDEAADDLMKSRQLLEDLVAKHPQVPAYHGALGRTRLSLVRLHRVKGEEPEAAKCISAAQAALGEALRLSPEYADADRTRKELEAASARRTKP